VPDCKHCKATDLSWKQKQDGKWRLADDNGYHECAAYAGRDNKVAPRDLAAEAELIIARLNKEDGWNV
jgi:hypothetical protein